MEIKSNKEEMIFKKDFNGKISYSLGLSKKDKEGRFVNGYMPVQFKKDVKIENKTKIKIKEAWLGFNIYENKTYPYIFINDFDVVQETQNPYTEFGNSIKTESEIGEQIQITDEDLPF